jgi:hypothetical protein
VDGDGAGDLAEAALLRLSDAEQPDDVGAVGVEAQQPVRNGPRVGREKAGAVLVLQLAHLGLRAASRS